MSEIDCDYSHSLGPRKSSDNSGTRVNLYIEVWEWTLTNVRITKEFVNRGCTVIDCETKQSMLQTTNHDLCKTHRAYSNVREHARDMIGINLRNDAYFHIPQIV